MLIDHVIAGGGLFGLLLAKALKEKFPDQEVVLFEKREFVGEMASSRNSGVLHAGLYYPFESLKRKHCIQGNILWQNLAKELQIPLIFCGKYLVSTTPEEDSQLEELFEKAKKNHVEGLRWCSQKEKKKLSSYINISQAFFSSRTGILDVSEAICRLEICIYNKGVHFFKNSSVQKIEREADFFEIWAESQRIKAKYFYNCAGVEAPLLRKELGLTNVESYPVKGNYLKLKGDFFQSSLIYPIPPKNLKGLGIHTSFGMDGKIRFGPDIEELEDQTCFSHQLSKERIDLMWPGVQKVFKNIKKGDLSLDYSGIRAKILYNGKLYPDFILGDESFHSIPRYFEFLGIESPGMTAAPSLVENLVKRIV